MDLAILGNPWFTDTLRDPACPVSGAVVPVDETQKQQSVENIVHVYGLAGKSCLLNVIKLQLLLPSIKLQLLLPSKWIRQRKRPMMRTFLEFEKGVVRDDEG